MTKPAPRERKERRPAQDRDRTTTSGTRALVLGPYLGGSAHGPAPRSGAAPPADRSIAARLAEAAGLAAAIDLDLVDAISVSLTTPRPSTYIGKGKVDEIAGLITAHSIGLVVVDCALSPVQQRNLEKAWTAKVIDRTGLILEIFGRRARTKEGALQVELAHLNYQKSRLVRSWTHLERQRGGFGFLGGPGETQIETDRRLIQDRIRRIEAALDEVKRTRGLHRASRKRVPFPIVALVGYTNAGKSTLFNRLTRAEVVAKDMLFATLDPTARAVRLPKGQNVVLSDTVGFISELPTMLIAAFRATLEDVLDADLILHVRDISHEDTEAQSEDVYGVLAGLGLDSCTEKPLIEVWNKLDLIDEGRRHELLHAASTHRRRERPHFAISALTGEGLPALVTAIETHFARGRTTYVVELEAADGRGLSWLYQRAEMLERRSMPDGRVVAVIRIAAEERGELERRFPGARMRGASA